jgi:hypothetical protein
MDTWHEDRHAFLPSFRTYLTLYESTRTFLEKKVVEKSEKTLLTWILFFVTLEVFEIIKCKGAFEMLVYAYIS